MEDREKLIEALDKIMSADFEQHTEEAGEILKILEKVSSVEDRIDLLGYFIQNFGLLPSSGQKMEGEKMNDFFSQAIREKLEKKGITEKLMIISEILTPPPLIAAQMLLGMLDDCADSQEKQVLLSIVMISRFTPYLYCPRALKMEQEKFISLVKKQAREIKKIDYLLRKTFSQKTERASEILKIIESASNFEERTVLLSTLIGSVESKNHIVIEIPPALKDMLTEMAAKACSPSPKKPGEGEEVN